MSACEFREITEARDPNQERPDYRGECDSCHAETALWIDWNDPGEWAMCEKCWRKARSRVQAARRNARRVVRVF